MMSPLPFAAAARRPHGDGRRGLVGAGARELRPPAGGRRFAFGPSLAVVAALCAMAMGCGDDKPKAGPWRPPAGAAVEETAKTPVSDKYIMLGENPKWRPIEDVFKAYKAKRIEGIENPMLSCLVDHIERPLIDKQREKVKTVILTVEGENDRPKDSDPRTWVALDRYKLVILMTGIARPKGVVISPNGKRYVLERGDPIGREGGRVKAILQYKMLVSVPKETEPRVISIEPPLSQLGEDAVPSKDF